GGQPAPPLALAGLEPDRARRVVDHELVLGQPLPVEDEDAGQPRLEAHLDVGLRCGDAPGRRPDLPDVGVQRLATLIGCVGVEAQERKQADDEREPADDDHHAPRMDLLARPCACDARSARHARLLVAVARRVTGASAANSTRAFDTVAQLWRGPVSPISPAACSPTATDCSPRSARAEADTCTSPTTSTSAVASR